MKSKPADLTSSRRRSLLQALTLVMNVFSFFICTANLALAGWTKIAAEDTHKVSPVTEEDTELLSNVVYGLRRRSVVQQVHPQISLQ